MANLIARILLISDFHWMIVPPWKQKGQTKKGFLGRSIEFFISIWKLFNNNAARKALEKISKMGPFTKVISLGDLAECEWNERGMILPSDVKEFEKLKELIESSTKADREDFHYLAGDHELGYILSLSSDPDGGISWRSVDNFQSVFSPLFAGFTIGKFNFILLCPSLFIQPINHLTASEKKYIRKLQDDQYNFVWNYFADRKKEGIVFTFLHDPDALEQFNAQVLNHNVLKGRKYKAFCGHMHAEDSLRKYELMGKIANGEKAKGVLAYFLRRFMCGKSEKGKKVKEWAKGNLRRLEIFRTYDLQVVPSTAGMMGKGGGFLILDLYDDGTYSVEKHKI